MMTHTKTPTTQPATTPATSEEESPSLARVPLDDITVAASVG